MIRSRKKGETHHPHDLSVPSYLSPPLLFPQNKEGPYPAQTTAFQLSSLISKRHRAMPERITGSTHQRGWEGGRSRTTREDHRVGGG
jgi:hypothetical protein